MKVNSGCMLLVHSCGSCAIIFSCERSGKNFLIRPVTLIPLSAMKKTDILMSDRFQLGPTAVIRGRLVHTDCQVCKR